MSVAIIKCTCKSEFQDLTYGKNMRLANLKGGEKRETEKSCTVCGTIKK